MSGRLLARPRRLRMQTWSGVLCFACPAYPTATCGLHDDDDDDTKLNGDRWRHWEKRGGRISRPLATMRPGDACNASDLED
jgi:hypothetical protein